jgi:hypothetical protein
MSLAKLTGRYDSKLLGREVDIDAMLQHPLEPDLDPAATALLQRYYRTRLWQRFIVGTRLSIVAGIHQHIQDLNAVLFLARAMSHHQQAPRLTETHVAEGLSHVEFNIANQPRVFDQKSLTWFTGQLDNPALALESRADVPAARRRTIATDDRRGRRDSLKDGKTEGNRANGEDSFDSFSAVSMLCD